MIKDSIKKIKIALEDKTPKEILKYCSDNFRNKTAFATSLGAEDQVLTEMIATNTPEIKIFTLDTGRLFPETYDLMDRTNKKYKIKIEVYFPDFKEVEKMVNSKGINLFFENVENRKTCCHVRKIEPLQRALEGIDIWVSGLRKEQGISRTEINIVDWDENNKVIKINPLYNWTEQMVWNYIKEKKVPYNPLHDKGFPSIGCQPCTRAIFPGEDTRAGRWWWENPYTRECGLHKNI